jgi:hypothetical protein
MKFQNQIIKSDNKRNDADKPLISVASISLINTDDINEIIQTRLGVVNYTDSSSLIQPALA